MLKTSLVRNVCVLAGALMVASAATSLCAQQVNVAQIAGQVIDSTGAVIPAATVRMTETQRGVVHTAVTNGNGQYVMPGLPVGPYQLQVQKSGFKTYVEAGIELQVNDHITLNAMLQPGAVSEVVEVHAGAATVQTEEASISNVIDSKPISELPLNGRYATQLVITSGASMMAPGGDETGSKNFYSSVTISVAGGQANATNYLLDGGDNNDTFSNVNLPFPFPDALQEFSVETSSLPARNGLHPGGVVNLVTKSGTNALHGNVFEFYRGGAFNAKPAAFTPAGTTNDNLLRNQFGGTIGGKIISDKLFFFAGYQGTRQHSAGTATAHTFTQAALTGDFTSLASATCTSNGKPKTLAAPFVGNKVNPTLFDGASLKLATGGFIPISSDPCGLLRYTVPAIDNEDFVVGRMDYNFNSKHSLYGRYLIDDFRAPPPFNPQNLILTQTPGNLERAQSLTLGDSYSFGPSLINAAHVTVTRRRDDRGVDPRDINPTTLGSNMFVAIPDFLLLSVSGYFGVGCGTCAPGFFNVNTLTATDDVDWIRGRHHFAFGVVAIRTQNNTLTGFDENGTFTFGGAVTGDGLADFLLGRYSSSSTGFTQSRAQKVAYRETIPGLYAQDTFRLNRRISLSAGVRWEPSLWPTDVFHRGSFFDLQAFSNNQHSTVFPTAPAGMMFFGDPGVPAAFTNNHLMNFAPRVGIAVDPFADGKMSIRAGYGIFYDSSMVWYSQRLTSNPPVVNQIDLQTGCGTFSNPWLNYSIATGCGSAGANQNPFPGGSVSFPGNSFWVSLPSDMRPMYMQQWNFSLQREFARDWVASVSYLGSKSLHVPLSYDFNAPQVTPSACAAVGGCTVKNENGRRFLTLLGGGAAGPQSAGAIGTLDLAFDSGYANYNGFLASLQHRFAKGISLQTNYTYSKCMSNGDFNGDLRATYFEIQSNPKADYGPCNFDVKHIYNATLVAQSPFQHGLMGTLMGHWQFSSTIRATSGWPINVTAGADIAETGEGLDRPNLVAGQPLYIKQWQQCNGSNWCYQWLNPAAFSVPTATTPGGFGNAGRDFVYSPGLFNFDAAISRRFKIREPMQFEIRFEAFNAINHFNANIGGPGTTMAVNTSLTSANSNFGRQIAAPTPGFVPSVYDPRILQFGAKLYF